MEYIYIGFMLAIGGCLGVGTCLFVWRKPKLAVRVLLYVVYLVLIVWAGAYLWFTYSAGDLTAWLRTHWASWLRPDGGLRTIPALIGTLVLTAAYLFLYGIVLLIGDWLRPYYRRYISKGGLHNGTTTSSNAIALCPVCKHPEIQHKQNRCLRDGCSCRVRPNIKGAVIAFSLAVFVLVLVIVMRGSGH
jgi:hypothetical protein